MRKVWAFVQWSVAALVAVMLAMSHAPPLGILVVWCLLAILNLTGDDR